jgi:tetratricopeptide (TPR) repeat protein/mono/diheme cytochrome c family protein
MGAGGRSLRTGVLALAALYASAPASIAPLTAAPVRQVTFAGDIAPIVYAKCAACHHDGGLGPFPLITYAAVKQHASQVADVTRRRYMPPWKPEPEGSGEFIGAPRLSQAEIDLIDTWVQGGAVEGDPRVLPPAPTFAGGWRLGVPDLIVSPAEAFALQPDGTDVFRIFVIPLPNTTLRYVKGLEFHPGNARVVHHANIRIDPTRASRQFDDADPLPGYDGLIAHSATYPDGHFLGWTPGQVPPLLPKGLAWRLEPGADLVVEVHMQPSGKPETVRPEIGFYFGDDPPERTPAMLRLGRQSIDIPAGERAYTLTDSFVLPVDVTVQAVQPHAHFRARQVRGVATLPDGSVRPLLSIVDWDFRWQDVYRFVEPLALPKGTTLSMAITYDNSAENPRNPWQPPRRVLWGQRSGDEMGDLWIQVLTRTAGDLDLLNRRFRPKILAEDVLGYEREIEREPSSVALHDDAAMLYLELQRPARAVEHFAISARLRPDSAAAHFNLGTALSVNGELDAAVGELERALAQRPDYAQAHNNLASILRARGDAAGANDHFREALRLDPANPEAHRNLAALSRDRGDLPEALRFYREALRLRPEWPAVMSELAWILATSSSDTLRDPQQAVRLAERTVQLTDGRDAGMVDVLAAAYAAAGSFDRAVAAAEAALRLAGAGSGADAIKVRLDLYRQHRPFVVGRD